LRKISAFSPIASNEATERQETAGSSIAGIACRATRFILIGSLVHVAQGHKDLAFRFITLSHHLLYFPEM
jgi:hypothetical protein